jgi:hypothetical protein
MPVRMRQEDLLKSTSNLSKSNILPEQIIGGQVTHKH